MTLWLDVEDLFHYGANNRRPSGIQRLSFELYAELHAILGPGVRFCRHDPIADTLRTVPWEAVQDLFQAMLAPAPPGQEAAGWTRDPAPSSRGRLRTLAVRLPLEVRTPLAQAFMLQRRALSAEAGAVRFGVRAVRAALSAIRTGLTGKRTAATAFDGQDVREAARPGDVLAVLGSPWFHPDYAGFIDRVAGRRGVRTALLVYDLIPLLRPEWCDQVLVRTFAGWVANFLPRVDIVLAISDATGRDVVRWADRSGIPLPLPVHTLPIGTGFSAPPPRPGATLPAGLLAGGYVLFVSTIEARKNHLLAFRAWRRMLDEMGADAVPVLVFAGHVGWLVDDLMQQLENCAYLDGKVVLVSNPGDAELAALYRGCRFTLFPSLYEGWGLPVTESLSFGKVCVASDRASVPEAGGPFCLYFDPEDIPAATDVIRRACTDDALIERMEARIRTEFRPITWRTSAEALLRHLAEPSAGPGRAAAVSDLSQRPPDPMDKE